MTKHVHVVLIALVAFLAVPFVFFAQSPTDYIFYLGRQDTDGDGLIGTTDTLMLYASVNLAEGSAISALDANVLQYAVNSTGATAAYTAQTSNTHVLDVVDLIGGSSRRIEIADLESTQVQVFDSSVWVVGLDAEQIPVLRGFDVTSGNQIGEHRFRRPNTLVSIHSSGAYVLAYNAETGGLTVLTLPQLQLVQFQIDAYAASAPVWSPVLPMFAIAGADNTDLNNVGIYRIDVNQPSTTRIADVAVEAPLNLQWSASGRYVLVAHANEINPDLTSMDIIDAFSGSTQTIGDAVSSVSIVDWSRNDEFALVSNRLPTSTIFKVYITAAASYTSVEAMGSININTASWNRDTHQIAFLGQSMINGQFGAYVADLNTGVFTILFESPDPTLASGVLLWHNAAVLFTGNSGDPVFVSTGMPTALYSATVASPTSVTRLSPPLVSVDTTAITVR